MIKNIYFSTTGGVTTIAVSTSNKKKFYLIIYPVDSLGNICIKFKGPSNIKSHPTLNFRKAALLESFVGVVKTPEDVKEIIKKFIEAINNDN